MNVQSKNVMIFGEVRTNGRLHPATLELTGKGRELADALSNSARVSVVLCCGKLEDDARLPVHYGADEVILVEHPSLSFPNPEVAVKILVTLVKERQPEILLAPATPQGRCVFPAVAAKCRTGLTADCTGLGIEKETGLLLQTRPAIGGNVIATIKTPNHRPQMATVRPKTFAVPEPRPRKGEVVRPSFPQESFQSLTENLDFTPFQDKQAPVRDAEVVISGGKGLRRAEGFGLLRELADLLGGSVGATRPTVEAKWIPYAHQVGLSGQVVSPKVYLAAGISGAVQHLAGMQTSRKIVSVNKDPEAPIHKIADIALCGDLYEILPQLIQRIREERGTLDVEI